MWARREPSQHNIVLFPKKNLETCILSIAHAIPMQPLRVKAVAVTRNSIPVGSKANTDRNALDRMVKMGEKRSMTSVLRPNKEGKPFGLYRQIAVGCQQQLMESQVMATPARVPLSRLAGKQHSITNGTMAKVVARKTCVKRSRFGSLSCR